MSETELLQAFRQKRSEPAFAQLVRRYAPLVYSVAKRRLANASLAEDVTQLVFIRLAKNPPGVQSPAQLAAWLHRTAVNVAIDTWRTETRRHNREQQAVAMEPATPEDALWQDIAPQLDDALNQIKEEERQALLLRFFGQKPMREVGAALGVSEDAAKMRVSRALDRLRTQLGVSSMALTTAVLGTLLMERSVEAVPVPLLSRLGAIRPPTLAGLSGLAGLLSALLQTSKLNLAAGAMVLAMLGVATVRLFQSLKAPAPNSTQTTNLTSTTNPIAPATASWTRLDSPSSGTSLAMPPLATPPLKPVKLLLQVLDSATGDGLASVKVRAAYFGVGGLGEGHDLVTDSAGTAAIREPNDPTKNRGLNVFVAAEAHVPKAVSFYPGAVPAEYTIKLDPAMTVAGRVVDEQGLPVDGVKILVEGPGDTPGQRENVDFQTCPVTSHADGTWKCSYIPFDYTNEIRFILKKPGYATTVPVVPVPRVDLNNLALVLTRGFTLTGRVLNRQNHLLIKARIKVLTGEMDQQQSVRTDENGVFTLKGLVGESEFCQEPPLETNDEGAVLIRGLVNKGPLHVRLAVQAAGFAPQTRTVQLTSLTNVIDFILAPGRSFRGQVTDEWGNPIPNAVVQTDWDSQALRPFDWQTRTDANGRFEWDSAPEVPTLFWIEADGYQPQRDVSLVADGTDHQIMLQQPSAR